MVVAVINDMSAFPEFPCHGSSVPQKQLTSKPGTLFEVEAYPSPRLKAGASQPKGEPFGAAGFV